MLRMVPAARFGRRDLLVWVVPGSRDNFFRHAQGVQEPRGTELIAGAQPVLRTDSQAQNGPSMRTYGCVASQPELSCLQAFGLSGHLTSPQWRQSAARLFLG